MAYGIDGSSSRQRCPTLFLVLGVILVTQE